MERLKDKIPYVGYGDKGYITQDVAEQHVKTADYWYEEFLRQKSRFDMLNNWQEIEFNRLIADKKTDNRIIMLLSVVCFIQGLFLIGGSFL